MEIHIQAAGILLIALSFIHFIFPRYFKWEIELSSLSLINRQMMYVHTFFIAIVVCLMGLLCVSSSEELVSTALGKRISLGLGIFWSARLLIQFFGYSSTLWRGKPRETAIHILFAFLWTYLSFVFLENYWF